MKSGLLPLTFALLALPALDAAADTHYVDLNSPSPTPPYTNWPTAATNIQDAVDAAEAGDTVLVTNGVYATGGRVVFGSMTNRVVINKPISVMSMNGPDFTTIQGHQSAGTMVGQDAIRCVLLTNGALLSGFTITGGATKDVGDFDIERSGGGIASYASYGLTRAGYASNCIITGNFAHYGGGGAYRVDLEQCLLSSNVVTYYRGGGGGAYICALTNCILVGNQAIYPTFGTGGAASSSVLQGCVLSGNNAISGGGAYNCALANCILTDNTAGIGGGAQGGTMTNCTIVGNQAISSRGGVYLGTLNNCVVFANNAPTSPNYSENILTMNHCCTTPIPNGGIGNITNEPLFINTNNWSDLRLQSNSPCINAGNNAYVSGSTDLDGNPRISGGTMDMGAYEFQSPGSVLSYAWAQQYGLPTDGSADFADTDGEGANNWQEWRAGTVPTNAASALRMAGISNAPTGLAVTWDSVTNRSYWLERADDLGAAPSFQTVATNLPGVTGPKTFADTGATNGGPYYYRVGVE